MMSAAELVTLHFMAQPRHQLRAQLAALADASADQVFWATDVCGNRARIPCDAAAEIAAEVLAERLAAIRGIPDALRDAACCHPIPSGDCSVNLAAWVDLRSPEWHTVFSYSSPGQAAGFPDAPWFCQLDIEAQRLVLLLVAEAEETIT